jgi:AcrR family transcriptional regulator
MKRERLTREESRQQTRERLLCSARSVFITKGFAAATIEEISHAAGYSRGAFYGNFGYKWELLLSLLKLEQEDLLAALQSIHADGASSRELQERAIAYYSCLYRNSGSLLLSIEAKLLAARDARFRKHFNLLNERLERHAECVSELSALMGTQLPLPALALAMALIALCESAGLFCMLNSQTLPANLKESLLAGFLSQIVLARKGD